ncbi:MAG: hypothetical protein K2N35_03715 [Muribaculaceae bacterium]|nr:hypothetical protein [Muribaculaceae bacterium]
MNKLTKITIFISALLAFVSCDTAEDAFSVGDKPKENEILSLSLSQLSFKPEGESFDIQISSIAKWEVSMSNNNSGQFSVSSTSGKGNGVVTVTCKPNSTQNSFSAELLVSPLNFEMEPVKVSLNQNNATFSIERTPSLEPIPEEGGSVTMTAYSSLNWEIAVLPHDADGNVGDVSWLSVTPGMSGEGNDGNTPIEYRFTWSPNYTEKERIIRLQLKPSTDMTLSNLPQPFTLTQEAGTRPQGVTCIVDNLGIIDADVTLEYISRSQVRDCGLRIFKIDGGSESLFNTIRPDVSSFANSGNYKLHIKDLPENSSFRIEPFVENEVGVATGVSRDISTGLKPENMTYQGVSIVNADNGGITVSADLNSATLSFTVMSDVEPLGRDRIASVTMTVNGNSVNGIAEKIDSDKWNYVFKVTDLQSNQEYQYSIEVKGKDLPREMGVVVNNTTSYSGHFKTQGMTPDFEDNEKPNVGA